MQYADVPWYVVWSEARAEKKVAERLSARGYRVWLPTVTEKHRWSDRWKMVTRPLFPGYLFAATGEGHIPLLKTSGVLTVVKEGSSPAQLSARYVAELKRIIEHPEIAVEATDTKTSFLRGDHVHVAEGPLAGYCGRVVEVRGVRRLVVWIGSIGHGLLCTLRETAVTRHSEVGQDSSSKSEINAFAMDKRRNRSYQGTQAQNLGLDLGKKNHGV